MDEIEMVNEDLSVVQGREIENTLATLKSLILECDAPTQEELRKLLAAQGSLLNTLAIQLMEGMVGRRKIERRLALILKVFDSSRAAIDSAARIKD